MIYILLGLSSPLCFLLHSPSCLEVQFGFVAHPSFLFKPLLQFIVEIFMFFVLFHVGGSGTSPDLVSGSSSHGANAMR